MFSDRMKNLSPYVPGEQPRDRKYLKLNTNENPYPPSPRIHEFFNDFDMELLRLYSDPDSSELCETIAGRYGIQKEQVFTGNGSDEVLAFAFYAFFGSERGELLFPEHTYSFYPTYCSFFDISYRKIPLNDDYTIRIGDYLEAGRSSGVIFPNPNAPTGILLSLDRIKALLDSYPSDRVVIVDEAYIDFGGESAVSLIDTYKNLLVVRTFSKSMSLAGMRLGFAMGDKALIDALYCVKDSFNSYPVDMVAQKVGAIAMEDVDYFEMTRKKIILNREALSDSLREMGWQVLPSHANFIFAGREGLTGAGIYEKLKEKGVLVRYFDKEGLRDFVRITVGTASQQETLLAAVRGL